MSSRAKTIGRGYSPWAPRGKTQLILDQIHEILDLYEDALTIRQIFYRLVAAYAFDKTEQAYERVLYYVNRGRRSRRIPFSRIRDDGIRGEDPGNMPEEPDDPEAWLADFLKELQTDYWLYGVSRSTGQPKRIELRAEASGMYGMVKEIGDRYGRETYTCGGADSVTARWEAAQRISRQPETPTVFLLIVDYDPPGEDIRDAFENDVRAFAAVDAPEAEIEFVWVGIKPEQAGDDTPSQPPKPPKTKSAKARLERWYADGHGDTYQVEALPPDRLREIIEEAIREHTDLDVLADMNQRLVEAHEWLKGEFDQRFGDLT